MRNVAHRNRLTAMSADGKTVVIRHTNGLEAINTKTGNRYFYEADNVTDFACDGQVLWIKTNDHIAAARPSNDTTLGPIPCIEDGSFSSVHTAWGPLLFQTETKQYALTSDKKQIALTELPPIPRKEFLGSWLIDSDRRVTVNGDTAHIHRLSSTKTSAIRLGDIDSVSLVASIFDGKFLAFCTHSDNQDRILVCKPSGAMVHKIVTPNSTMATIAGHKGIAILLTEENSLCAIDLRYGGVVAQTDAPIVVEELYVDTYGHHVLLSGFVTADIQHSSSDDTNTNVTSDTQDTSNTKNVGDKDRLSVLHLTYREALGLDTILPDKDTTKEDDSTEIAAKYTDTSAPATKTSNNDTIPSAATISEETDTSVSDLPQATIFQQSEPSQYLSHLDGPLILPELSKEGYNTEPIPGLGEPAVSSLQVLSQPIPYRVREADKQRIGEALSMQPKTQPLRMILRERPGGDGLGFAQSFCDWHGRKLAIIDCQYLDFTHAPPRSILTREFQTAQTLGSVPCLLFPDAPFATTEELRDMSKAITAWPHSYFILARQGAPVPSLPANSTDYYLAPLPTSEIAGVWSQALQARENNLSMDDCHILTQDFPMGSALIHQVTQTIDPSDTLVDIQRKLITFCRRELSAIATELHCHSLSEQHVVLSEEVQTSLQGLIARCKYLPHMETSWGLAMARETIGTLCLLSGPQGVGKKSTAMLIANQLGAPLFLMSSQTLQKQSVYNEESISPATIIAAIDRCLDVVDQTKAILLIEQPQSLPSYCIKALQRRLPKLRGLILATVNDRRANPFSDDISCVYTIDFEKPDKTMQLALWTLHIPQDATLTKDEVADLADRYDLTGQQIRQCVIQAGCFATAHRRPIDLADVQAAADLQSSM